MAVNAWSSTGSTDGNLAANWSLGWVPTTGDTATWDATSVVNCTLSAAISCDATSAAATYMGKIDLADGSYRHAVSGDVTLDCTAFDMGNSTLTVGGSFDCKDVTTWTAGTATLVMTGTGNLIGQTNAGTLANLIINNTATTTVATVSTYVGNLSTSGAVIINSGLYLGFTGTVEALAGSISSPGTGFLKLYYSASGKGIITKDVGCTISCPIQMIAAHPAAILAPGTYGGLMTVANYSTSSSTWTPSAGTYNFDGGLTVSNNNAAPTVTLNAANATTINITGNYTVTNFAAGTIAITNNVGNPNFNVTGNVTFTQSAGTLTYTKGTGTITLSGTAVQTVNLATKTVEGIIVNKPDAGTVTLTAGDALTAGGPWIMRALVPSTATITDNGWLRPRPWPTDMTKRITRPLCMGNPA